MGETTCKMKQEETRWNFIKIRIPNIIFIEICNKNTWYSFLIKNFFSDKYHHSMIIDTKYQYRIQLDECCLNGLRIICYVLVVSHAGQDSGLYCTPHSTLHGSIFTKKNFNVTTEPWILMIRRHQKVPNEFSLISLNY